jgi:hypothetical protein
VKLADQWAAVQSDLPDDWDHVRVTVTTEQHSELARAAQVLAPMNPGHVGETLVLDVRRAGGPAGPEAARRLFARLDDDRVWCTLAAGTASVAAPTPPDARVPLVEQWDAVLDTLPRDWSDLLCALTIGSTELLPLVSLRCAPLNPTRDPDQIGFVFRAARVAGYGASPEMVRRCLERLDAEGIEGTIGLRRLLADTGHVATQGPVWVVDGRMV